MTMCTVCGSFDGHYSDCTHSDARDEENRLQGDDDYSASFTTTFQEPEENNDDFKNLQE